MRKLIKIISAIFIFAIVVCSESFAMENEVWNSPQGMKRFEESLFKNDFYQLANYYQPQINPLYCSIATSVILLNAMHPNDEIPSQAVGEVRRPDSEGGTIIEYHSYSQLSFLNEKTDKIKKRDIIQLKAPLNIKSGKKIYDAGLSLSDFSDILSQVYGLKSKVKSLKRNDQKSVNVFREELKKYLSDSENFVVVNFDGTVLGTKTSGHFSPVGAYDQATDSVLIMDVALHKNPWYWAPLTKLYDAMNTRDGYVYRGYAVVSR